jgi:signal transduction histidine kinase
MWAERLLPHGIRRVPPLLADAGLALLVAAIASVQTSAPLPDDSLFRPPDALARLLVVLMCAPLVIRRRAPALCLCLVLAVALVIGLLGYPQNGLGMPFLVAIFTLGRALELRRCVPYLVAVVAVYAALYLLSRDPVPPSDPFLTFAFLGAGFWLGTSLRVRRTEAARQAVAEERLRIARELHDVVAHSMSVIAVQSGMAAYLLDSQPQRAREALELIASTSRTGLDELRRMLEVLRPDAESAGALTPVPGLDAVPELAEQLSSAGVAVTVQTTGERGTIAPGVDLTAYRVIQEALTNTFKHAGPGARATVRIDYGPDRLTVEVADDGRGVPPGGASGSGVGLVGMRERVSVFGGRLDVGPTAGGGWRVHAELPRQATP